MSAADGVRIPIRDRPVPGRSTEPHPQGTRLLVTLASDPGWHHERVVLYQAGPAAYVILTPDGDEYVEPEERWSSAVVMAAGDGYPPEATGGFVQFDSPVEDAELMQGTRRGRVRAPVEAASCSAGGSVSCRVVDRTPSRQPGLQYSRSLCSDARQGQGQAAGRHGHSPSAQCCRQRESGRRHR